MTCAFFSSFLSCSTAQDVEDVSDDEFETASDELMMKLMIKNGKMKMENLTKLSREEDGSDAQEWKEITVEEDETSESLSLN